MNLPEDEIWKISKYCAKMIFICSLIFLFLIKIRFPKGVSISEIFAISFPLLGVGWMFDLEKSLNKFLCAGAVDGAAPEHHHCSWGSHWPTGRSHHCWDGEKGQFFGQFFFFFFIKRSVFLTFFMVTTVSSRSLLPCWRALFEVFM